MTDPLTPPELLIRPGSLYEYYRRELLRLLDDLKNGMQELEVDLKTGLGNLEKRVHTLERFTWMALGVIAALQLALVVYSVFK